LFPSTLNGLIDGNPTSFLGSATTAGPGNVAYAFQWDLNLAANTGSRLFSVIQNLQVPEPSSLALALMGFAGWFAMRRRAA
jgi:hypothetical protein